jgi:hypothetical protein
MRFHRSLWSPIVLASLLSFVSSASAQDLTLFVGGQFPGSMTVQNVVTSLDKGPVYGVRFSTPFALNVKLEHTLAFSNDFLFPHSLSGITKANGLLYNTNLLVNIPIGKMVPYVTAGAGFMRQSGSPNLPIGTKFTFNYGGGLKLPKLLGPAGLRFDARGYTATGVFSHSVNLFEISGGVLFSF